MEERGFKNRDVNWLSFNERVLLEAQDAETPLLERLKFLAIYSSNLDEFFRVRISQLRQLKEVDPKLRKKLVLKANKRLKRILEKIGKQQKSFGKAIQDTLEGLREHGIRLNGLAELDERQVAFLQEYFETHLRADCRSYEDPKTEDIRDGGLYLIVDFPEYHEYAMVEIPTPKHPRFVVLPGEGHQVIFLDDIIKLNIRSLFPVREIVGVYALKLSRDAELYLDDDYTDTELVEKIYRSLEKRHTGQPTRLLYDPSIPEAVLLDMKQRFDLGEVDLVSGGTHHNLSDFFGFPHPESVEGLVYESLPPLPHPLDRRSDGDILEQIKEKDRLVHFPYQSFDLVERFLKAAATDPNVYSIKMSLYRMAKRSELTDYLLLALDNGKKVVLFVEAQARFDEENNIQWGRTFEERGATVIFSVPNIKVHSKIAMVERREGDSFGRYAYIGTGNFNAKTAKLYCDHGLFTANEGITADLDQVFRLLEMKLIIPKLHHLLVSPFTTRSSFVDLIQNEIRVAKEGRSARITIKMNSLEDSAMIEQLYAASEAGVEVRLLVRGFCCLITRTEDEISPPERAIVATSVVDRFLEHGRLYLFENDGQPKLYMGSADWMTRNLDRRVEVLVPIYDYDVLHELREILDIQMSDNVKARYLDAEDSNTRVPARPGEPIIRSQYAIYSYLKEKYGD